MLTEYPLGNAWLTGCFLRYRRPLCLLVASLVVVLLFVLGSQPVAVGLFPEPWEKLAHFAVFACIAALLWLAAGGRMPLLLIAVVAGIGALDEWHQLSLPGRSADYADFLTDVVAAVAVVTALHVRNKQGDY